MSVAPFIYTPLTKITEHWLTHQFSRCAEFEQDFYRCISRIGYNRFHMTEECHKEYDDFKECVARIKQTDRYVAMQNERKKQDRPYMERPADYTAKVFR